MVDHTHSLLCIEHIEDENIEDGGDIENDEDAQGHHQGGLGHCQWIGWLAKLAGDRILNTETAPEDIEDASEGGTRLGGDEDHIVHEALHGHVETVGVSQHLDVHYSLDIFKSTLWWSTEK